MSSSPFPIATGAQMAAVDRAMVEACGLELLQVMEVAGRAVAIVARSFLRSHGTGGSVAILCGGGGNGGDGLVCGRYLSGWGIAVELWLARPGAELVGLAGHQVEVCRRLGMAVVEPGGPVELGRADLIVDGIFGFGLSAAPSGYAAGLIGAANRTSAPILAIDLPSGIDATSGECRGSAIEAALTVTLGLPKQGLLHGEGPGHSGNVIVADIGIPAAAYAAAGIARTTLFQNAEFTDLSGAPWRPD